MKAFLKNGRKAAESTEGSSKSKKAKQSTPWVEKYRPKNIDEIVEQGEVVKVLKECLSSGDLPHLLFYGPPGTGKTSCILAAARELFGDIYRDRILELNASDDRGIQVVRDKIKNFAQLSASSTRPDGRSCPPYKLVILDEADSMTSAAQAALRRTMEKETRTTRFCLICNYVSKIIAPIKSRCSKFRFKPLTKEKMMEKLREICVAENVEIEESDALEMTVDTCEGDLRRAVTTVHCCYRLHGKLNKKGLKEVSGYIPDPTVISFLQMEDYNVLERNVEVVMSQAYSVNQLLSQLLEEIIYSNFYSSDYKCLLIEKIALCSHRMRDGASEIAQITDLGCTILVANVRCKRINNTSSQPGPSSRD